MQKCITTVDAVACVKLTASPLRSVLAVSWGLGNLQTWIEGEPVQGKSAKPAKPSKSAALQLLQQLASQHCQGACTSKDAADAAVSSNATAALYNQEAKLAACFHSVSSQPDMGTADDPQLVQPQPQPAVDTPSGSNKLEAEAELTSGIESDSEAEISLRGRVASDEEDDRQGPGPLAGPATSSAEAQGGQALSMQAPHTAGSEPDEATQAAEVTPDCALANVPRDTADKPHHQPSLSRVMQQQRRHVFRSQRKASSQPEVLLALTEAQQQQWQQEDNPTCGAGTAPSMAIMHECSSVSLPAVSAVSDAQPTAEQGRLNAQLDEQTVTQAMSEEGEQGGAGPSDRAQGQDEHQLWQNLAEALQDMQKSQKLAQQTVTLLGRM